jgi:hypothetical protein
LRAELKAIETLLETNGLPLKKDTLDKVRKQLAGVSALVDVWWQTVRQDLEQLAMTPRWTQWAEEVLLPLLYWHEQLRRTRCREQKAQIALVLQVVEEAFERHPCTQKLTPEVLAGWKAWAAEHARAFQRASSAVEGRNGYLSQMQHNHRGLSLRRSQVWTVLHNEERLIRRAGIHLPAISSRVHRMTDKTSWTEPRGPMTRRVCMGIQSRSYGVWRGVTGAACPVFPPA